VKDLKHFHHEGTKCAKFWPYRVIGKNTPIYDPAKGGFMYFFAGNFSLVVN